MCYSAVAADTALSAAAAVVHKCCCKLYMYVYVALCVYHRQEVNSPGCTLLHTAAYYSRSDCIPLLLAAGVDATALSSDAQRTALLQACVKCDLLTVQLLLQAKAWLPQFGTDCVATAVAQGSADVTEELYTATTAAATTAAAAAAAVAAVNSGPVCSCLPAGFTLMHVAAAARSLRCAEVLLRHGLDATAVTQAEQHTTVDAATGSGISALDLLVLKRPSCGVLSTDDSAAPPELTPAEFDRFALLLLSCGATIKHSVMTAQQYNRYAGAVQQHTARLQQQARQKARVAAVHSAACRQTASSSSSSSGSGKVVRVQLAHTGTQQLGATVYTVNTELMAQLLSVGANDAVSTTAASSATAATATAAASAGNEATAADSAAAVKTADTSSSYATAATQQSAVAAQQHVLMKMLVPSEGWQCAATDAVTFISCDGKST
jgi:trimeric autotransporter adhesin